MPGAVQLITLDWSSIRKEISFKKTKMRVIKMMKRLFVILMIFGFTSISNGQIGEGVVRITKMIQDSLEINFTYEYYDLVISYL